MSEGKIILKAEDVRTYFPVKGALGQTVKEVKAVDGVSLALRAKRQAWWAKAVAAKARWGARSSACWSRRAGKSHYSIRTSPT